MINPQWLELLNSGTNFHEFQDVQAIKVGLLFKQDYSASHDVSKIVVREANNIDPDQRPYFAASDLGLHCLPMSVRILRVYTSILYRHAGNEGPSQHLHHHSRINAFSVRRYFPHIIKSDQCLLCSSIFSTCTIFADTLAGVCNEGQYHTARKTIRGQYPT